MKTVYKYNLLMTQRQNITMPLGYQLLNIEVQNGIPRIWAKVDTDQPDTEVELATYGTGEKIEESDNLRYIGTFQINGLVAHVFEVEKQ